MQLYGFIGLAVTVFAKALGDRGSNPNRITKNSKNGT